MQNFVIYLFNTLNFRFSLRFVGRETRTCQYEWVSVVGPMFGRDQAGILLLNSFYLFVVIVHT